MFRLFFKNKRENAKIKSGLVNEADTETNNLRQNGSGRKTIVLADSGDALPVSLSDVFGCSQNMWSEIDRSRSDAFAEKAVLLQRRGMIVSLWGPSKIGKTTLVRQVFKKRNVIEVHGRHARTLEQFFDAVRVALNAPERTVTTSRGSAGRAETVRFEGGGGAEAFGIKAEITSGYISENVSRTSNTISHEYGRHSPPQLIRQLIDLDAVVVVDDAHAISFEVQAEILRDLRGYLSNSGTICLVSVPECLTRVLADDSELSALACVIEAPSWSSRDLAEICYKGFKTLGVSVPEATVRKLVRHCNFNPLLLQILLLNLCKEYQILETQHPPCELNPTAQDMKAIVRSTAAERPRPAYVEMATQADETWKLSSGRQVSIYTLILLGIRHIGFQQEIGVERLTERISDLIGRKGAKPNRSVVTRALNRLSNELERRLQHNTPLAYDAMTHRVYFLDPFLLMHLQWVFAPAFGEAEPSVL